MRGKTIVCKQVCMLTNFGDKTKKSYLLASTLVTESKIRGATTAVFIESIHFSHHYFYSLQHYFYLLHHYLKIS